MLVSRTKYKLIKGERDDTSLLLAAERTRADSLAKEVARLQAEADERDKRDREGGGDVAQCVKLLDASLAQFQTLPPHITHLHTTCARVASLEARDEAMSAWADEMVERLEGCADVVRRAREESEMWREVAERRGGEIAHLTSHTTHIATHLATLRASHASLSLHTARLTHLARSAARTASEAVDRGRRAEEALERGVGVWRDWWGGAGGGEGGGAGVGGGVGGAQGAAAVRGKAAEWDALKDAIASVEAGLDAVNNPEDPTPCDVDVITSPPVRSRPVSPTPPHVPAPAPTTNTIVATTAAAPPLTPTTPSPTSPTQWDIELATPISAIPPDDDDDATCAASEPGSVVGSRKSSGWSRGGVGVGVGGVMVPFIAITPATPTSPTVPGDIDGGGEFGAPLPPPPPVPAPRSAPTSNAPSPSASLRRHRGGGGGGTPPAVRADARSSKTHQRFQRQRSSWPDKRPRGVSTSAIPSSSGGVGVVGRDRGMHTMLPPSSAMAAAQDGGQRWGGLKGTGNTFYRMKSLFGGAGGGGHGVNGGMEGEFGEGFGEGRGVLV
ncbi:hypothetical protein M427DRAFT_27544 [Gonapodya prolifera JEL478]|uniref:Uncharacterized protein n=1 Tax=Gonapodya prolifera (strain JEL478) TaxID=1344416 RepID=A0A139AWK9_GONPJ|nr:hypothetical protein M427DRAFT_27544 [Gonapodya prolifera JEL478]|eukprot:KXS21089.1 hypothetical protein M427DRAFT_27544 [Gonapodya prolifera JEL478]